LLASVTPTWQFSSDWADFTQAINLININNETSVALNNTPPNIFFETTPTELIFIDGEPILQHIDGSELYKSVVNTPYFIIYSTSDGFYYLQAGDWWFRTKEIYNEWQLIGAPPQAIISLFKKFNQYNSQNNNNLTNSSLSKPKLIVVLHQAALIQTKGEPEFIPIPNTSLSYLDNSENDLLKDHQTNTYYVRFSGRWYASSSLIRGKWTFIAPHSLPIYFQKIPAQSKIGRVRISIPGTPEAMNAALDNAIPQTAVVDRRTAKISIEFDGEPVFESITGTSLQYAVNSNISLLKTSNNHYAVDEGIWFSSNSPTTGWQVASERPKDVNNIPPSVPVYNIKYVYIYDTSNDLAYVGYTGGYTGTFLYQGCLFYGTGYDYKPWYKSKYYARPLTYAFGVNRTSGKGSNIHISVGIGYGYPGFYAPYGYYGGGYGYGAYASTTMDGNYEYKKGYETKPLDVVNIYNNRVQGIVHTVQAQRNNPYKVLPENQQGVNGQWVPPTNMYSDSAGNVYKQQNDGTWQKRVDGVWVKVKEVPKNP